MPTIMKTKRPVYRYASTERAKAIEPFVGKVCKVTYRSGALSDFDRELTGRILGASYHCTNGNSTGDVVVAPVTPGNAWKIDGAWYHVKSIALANCGTIEEVS